MKSVFLSALFTFPVFVTSSTGEIIASTTFDGRTANENTAENIPWMVNGIADPGNMSADRFDGGPINLFDNTGDVQDRFVPGINTGNGNTSWVTTVNLTPSPGTTVTVENVSFGYVAISGAQVINVNRRSDFEITLLDPSGTTVASGSISEALSGFNVDPVIAPVSIDLDAPVTLDQPGTYSLVIRGGDFLDQNETGNHTGIDDLVINGTIGGGASLEITEFSINGSNLSLTWNSNPGVLYSVKFSQDLSDWSQQLGESVLAEGGESTTLDFDLSTLDGGTPSSLFFRVEIQE